MNSSNLRMAVWSADYMEFNGQALVTARVVRNQPSISWQDYVYRGRGWRSAVSWMRAVIGLWRDVVRGRIDALYLVCSRSNAGFLRDIPALLLTWAGVRVLVHVHGSDIVDLLTGRRVSPLARALYARCEIIVPSLHLAEPLRGVSVRALHVCENYFIADPEELVPPSRPRDTDTLAVLWNSNVMASKGFFDVAKAVQRLWDEGLAVRFVSVGQPLGDEEMTAQEAASRLQMFLSYKWLDYHGKVEPAFVAKLNEEADVVCLPSRYSSECQPLALIQAMCSGKAIVASDIPALRATLKNYPAHLVPPYSVEAIAEALRELYHKKHADLAAFSSCRTVAAAAAKERFSPQRFDREMAGILIDVG